MTQMDRSTAILNLLTHRKRLEVAQLAEELKVSQVTIRKDLDQLALHGLVIREHGYAQLNTTDDISERLAYHYEEKKKIARRAAVMVQDGDTIMIESGSCCALLASTLTHEKKHLTIVTNSAFIAGYIRGQSDFQIVLLGGIYQQDSQCLVGPMVRDGASNYHIDVFFVGTDGYNSHTGFTNKDQMRAQAVRDMAQSCDHIVFLTESEKFLSSGTVPLRLQDHPITVITDSHISDNAMISLEQNHIELITV